MIKSLLLLFFTLTNFSRSYAMQRHIVVNTHSAANAIDEEATTPKVLTEAENPSETKAIAEAIKLNKDTPQRLKQEHFPETAHLGRPIIQLINEYLASLWDYSPEQWLGQVDLPRPTGESIDRVLPISDRHVLVVTARPNYPAWVEHTIRVYDRYQHKYVKTVEETEKRPDECVRHMIQLSDNTMVVVYHSGSFTEWNISEKTNPTCTNRTAGAYRCHGDILIPVSEHRYATLFTYSIYLNDIRTGSETCSLERPTNMCRSDALIKINGNLFASGGNDGVIKFWHITQNHSNKPTFACCGALEESAHITALGKVADTILIAGLKTGDAHIWDITDLKKPILLTTFKTDEAIATIICLSEEAAIMGCLCKNNKVVLFDMKDPKKPKALAFTLAKKKIKMVHRMTEYSFLTVHEDGSATLWHPSKEKIDAIFNQKNTQKSCDISDEKEK